MPRKTPPIRSVQTTCHSRFNEAAARCRGKPAESEMLVGSVVAFNEAAARCRGKPSPATPPAESTGWPFNEAAARCRGKPGSTRSSPTAIALPSMRPRPDAAENRPSCARRDSCPTSSFNEAAARCRGKPLVTHHPHAPDLPPSMRPRPDAAENHPSQSGAIGTSIAFNEAAARCRGKPASRCARFSGACVALQ